MKKLLTLLFWGIASLCLSVPLTLAGSALDLSHIPKCEGPWRVSGSDLLDASNDRFFVVGTNTAGYGNLPESMTQANSWTLKPYRMGSRVNRSHHIDVLLFDHNWGAHKPRLDIYISSHKKRGVPTILDIASQRIDVRKIHAWDAAEWDKWKDQATRLLTHVPALSNLKPYAQEPYIVGICPLNEDIYFPEATAANAALVLEKQTEFLRSLGYKGLIWGANAGIPDGWVLPGDVECFHRYLDHPYGDTFWNTKEADQPWNWYRRKTAKPLINTELGSLWPAKTRALSEMQIVDHAITIGAQLVMPFALVTRPEQWDSTARPLEQYAFFNDPARLSTVRYAALRMNGGLGNLVYVPPEAQNAGFMSEIVADQVKMALKSSGGLPVIESIEPTTIVLPVGKIAYALDTLTGKRLYQLPIEIKDGARYVEAKTAWTELQ